MTEDEAVVSVTIKGLLIQTTDECKVIIYHYLEAIFGIQKEYVYMTRDKRAKPGVDVKIRGTYQDEKIGLLKEILKLRLGIPKISVTTDWMPK